MHSFGFKGTRWTSGIAADGHRAATPVCPEHDHREAKVLVALNDQVLVWCPDCGLSIYIQRKISNPENAMRFSATT